VKTEYVLHPKFLNWTNLPVRIQAPLLNVNLKERTDIKIKLLCENYRAAANSYKFKKSGLLGIL